MEDCRSRCSRRGGGGRKKELINASIIMCIINFVREKTRGKKRTQDSNELCEEAWGRPTLGACPAWGGLNPLTFGNRDYQNTSTDRFRGQRFTMRLVRFDNPDDATRPPARGEKRHRTNRLFAL
jgi:hypothetical protein